MCNNCQAMFEAYYRHGEFLKEIGEATEKDFTYSTWQAYRDYDTQLQACCTDLHPELEALELKQSKVTLLYKGHSIVFREDVINAVQRAISGQSKRQTLRAVVHNPGCIPIMCKSVDGARIFLREQVDEEGVRHTFTLVTSKIDAKEIELRVDERDPNDSRFADLLRKLSMHKARENWSQYLLTLWSLTTHKSVLGTAEVKSTSRHGTWNEFEPIGDMGYDW